MSVLERVVLVDTNPGVVEAWQPFFRGLDLVEIHHGDILEHDVDAFVSPANSFGFMDGGIDKVYMRYFAGIQDKVQDTIRSSYYGELPVGQAAIIPTGRTTSGRYLIVAPTMRVPRPVFGTVNPMLAFRAVLDAVREHNDHAVSTPIKSFACPGLCTGVGMISPMRSSTQMRYAWGQVMLGNGKQKKGLSTRGAEHSQLTGRY